MGPAVVVVVGMDSSSDGDREDGRLLLTVATGVHSEEGCGLEVQARSLDGREAGRRRAAGWARSGGASEVCAVSRHFFGMVIIVVMVYRCAEAVQQQACQVQRGITLLLKNPKLLIYR